MQNLKQFCRYGYYYLDWLAEPRNRRPNHTKDDFGYLELGSITLVGRNAGSSLGKHNRRDKRVAKRRYIKMPCIFVGTV